MKIHYFQNWMWLSKQGQAWRSGLMGAIHGTVLPLWVALNFNLPQPVQCMVINTCTTWKLWQPHRDWSSAALSSTRYFNGGRGILPSRRGIVICKGSCQHPKVEPSGADSLRKSFQTLPKDTSFSEKGFSCDCYYGTALIISSSMCQHNTAGFWANPRSIFVVLSQLSPASFKVHKKPSGVETHQQCTVARRPPHQWCISCARSNCGRLKPGEGWLNSNDAAVMLAVGRSAERRVTAWVQSLTERIMH